MGQILVVRTNKDNSESVLARCWGSGKAAFHCAIARKQAKDKSLKIYTITAQEFHEKRTTK
ncbi:hypothetical protein A6C57_23290 [Fibrella sp. ES10-3-2-2]|nr:hypothetical protein A6C57_23290 [Fibrella sp. ES10-3-2-2]